MRIGIMFPKIFKIHLMISLQVNARKKWNNKPNHKNRFRNIFIHDRDNMKTLFPPLSTTHLLHPSPTHSSIHISFSALSTCTTHHYPLLITTTHIPHHFSTLYTTTPSPNLRYTLNSLVRCIHLKSGHQSHGAQRLPLYRNIFLNGSVERWWMMRVVCDGGQSWWEWCVIVAWGSDELWMWLGWERVKYTFRMWWVWT